MNSDIDSTKLTIADFTTDQEVRWCPGCGDYSILKAVRKTMAEAGVLRENTVVVSGIGCAARFPYYVDCYGFHTIHGRAPTIATGALLANPDLDVWIATGDGDALSIGGNHMVHILRRNVNCKIILFNNEIYGLTKGQYSPTSRQNTISPSSPVGSLDSPLNAAHLALGSGARFVARAVDIQQAQLASILKAAHEHKGASFVEVFQNCHVFNDNVFADFTARDKVADNQIQIENGEKLLYGGEKEKGLRFDPDTLELVACAADEGVLRHNSSSRTLAMALADMDADRPVATGVLYNDPAPVYQNAVHEQIAMAKRRRKSRTIQDVMNEGYTWKV
ncbi:MAG: 2-oxoacid:ferredoxin oxidoreductase subunit beta [Hyphomicrobiales bacterium]|nr:2-oxoacid:ferredoxin oxidoreductase subunit beta [Hyphomicrobiales bacterium]